MFFVHAHHPMKRRGFMRRDGAAQR